MRADLKEIRAPEAQALFETRAEVLAGLDTVFDHDERGAESAMREH